MKKFLKTLKTKIEEKDSWSKESEDRFLTNFKDEFKEQDTSIWSVFQIRHAVAACLLIAATVSVYKTRDNEITSSSMANIQILENEVMLSNMDVLEELDEFEDLTDEDWEVLVGEVN